MCVQKLINFPFSTQSSAISNRHHKCHVFNPRPPYFQTFQFPALSNTNMTAVRTCELEPTLLPLNNVGFWHFVRLRELRKKKHATFVMITLR